jgi:hypothetical protein
MWNLDLFICSLWDNIMKKILALSILFALSLPAFSTVAVAADCAINGNIVATRNTDTEGLDWVYTLTIEWNTGSKYALSHISLMLDEEDGSCSCNDFYSVLSWEPVIGSSSGGSSCETPYYGDLSCKGDPSIPGVGGVTLKFEPMEGCEPGTFGGASFTFYSDLRPAPVNQDILSLVDKSGQNSCFGSLTGEFPGLPCDPVAAEDTSWGRVKGLYR